MDIFPRDTGTINQRSLLALLVIPEIRYLRPHIVDVRVDANVLSLPLSSF